MTDERTLATEIRELFQALGSPEAVQTKIALAKHFNVRDGSEQFYLAVGAIERNLQQLKTDISAANLKAMSKDLYSGAVVKLAQFITPEGLVNTNTAQIAKSTQAFEYLMLVDDVLAPLDHRDVPAERIKELRDRILELLDSLDVSEIDPRLKEFIRAHISNLLWAVDNFHFVGIDGVCRTFGAAHAEILRSAGFHGAGSEAARKWYRSAIPALGYLGMAITTCSAVIEKTDNILTHGSSLYEKLTGQDDDKKIELNVQIGTGDKQNKKNLPALSPGATI